MNWNLPFAVHRKGAPNSYGLLFTLHSSLYFMVLWGTPPELPAPPQAARNCTVGIPNVLGGTSDCAGKAGRRVANTTGDVDTMLGAVAIGATPPLTLDSRRPHVHNAREVLGTAFSS